MNWTKRSNPYRQRLDRAIGHRAPVLGTTPKRAILTGMLSIPIALLALAIADNGSVPRWLHFIISPGSEVGLRWSPSEPCGGLLDCLVQVGVAVGRTAEIAWIVNTILYGLLIFGLAAIVRRSRKQQTNAK